MIKEKLLEANKKGELEITGVRPLDRFYLITGKDYMLLKKIKEPTPIERFEKLTGEIQAKFNESGIRKAEISRAIKWARKK